MFIYLSDVCQYIVVLPAALYEHLNTLPVLRCSVVMCLITLCNFFNNCNSIFLPRTFDFE